MYFALSPDRLRRREVVENFVAEHAAEDQVRAAMASPETTDEDAWLSLRAALPAGDFVDDVVLLEVLGAALYPGPQLSAVVAVHAFPAVRAQDSGRTVVVLPRAPGDALVVDGTASGTFAAVPDAVGADHFLVAGEVGDWYAVSASDVAVTARDSFDQTRRLASVQLSGVRASRVDVDADAVRAHVRIVERVAMAAELAGAARAALDLGVAYAKTREQFGRPIGAFQALQHRFADVALAVESAWGAVYSAAWDVDHDPARAELSSSLAAATAGDAALDAAEQVMQVHGGEGFTWRNPSHLYLKRAKSNRLLWGHPDEHRRRLGDLLQL